jgi:hypothetical protein
MNAVRSGAAWIYRILITLFTAGVVVQFFLAGLGIFDAIPEGSEQTTSSTWEDKIDPHAALGHLLFIPGAILLLIVILVAWPGPRAIGATFGLAVLMLIQIILGGVGEDTPGLGALHPVNAVLILALSLFLTWRAWRGNLLIPPSQLRLREGAATPR